MVVRVTDTFDYVIRVDHLNNSQVLCDAFVPTLTLDVALACHAAQSLSR